MLKRTGIWIDLCQNRHCQQWKTAKEKAESTNCFVTVDRDLSQGTLVFSTAVALLPNTVSMATQILFCRLAHIGDLGVSTSELGKPEESKKGDIQHSGLELPELNQIKQKQN